MSSGPSHWPALPTPSLVHGGLLIAAMWQESHSRKGNLPHACDLHQGNGSVHLGKGGKSGEIGESLNVNCVSADPLERSGAVAINTLYKPMWSTRLDVSMMLKVRGVDALGVQMS